MKAKKICLWGRHVWKLGKQKTFIRADEFVDVLLGIAEQMGRSYPFTTADQQIPVLCS